jgi:hypothetical protein
MRQAGTAKPRLQLEAVLQRLLVIILVGRVFYDDGVISFADLPPLLGLGFSSLRNLDSLRGRLRLGDEPLQVVLRDTRHQCDYSQSNDYSTRGYDYLPP